MKIKPLNIFVSALVTLSAFFFASGLCLAEEKSITQAVTISALAGKVEVLPKDALDWKEAEIGMQLNDGDKIKTTEDGKAELIFQDGSFIRMKPNTTLGVRTLRQEVSTEVTHYNLELRVGEIMAEVRKLKKGSSFEVETPTAVAAVRGTTYYMRAGTRVVNGIEKSFVEIYVDSDDTILFTSTVSGDSFIVSQAQGAIVFGDGAVEGPFDIPPAAQDAWKSGFDMYDDSDGSKGMRDVGDEDADDDTSGDVDDTTGDQDDALSGANDERTGEQDIYGLAQVTIITDTDGDGIPDDLDTDDDNDGILDSWEQACEINETNYNTNYLLADTDSDEIDDFEDAFPNDAYNPEIDKIYGLWEDLHQAAVDNLAIENLQDLREDISYMIDDIHARGFEAVKEKIFDHQAGKVMRDRWGNRVRVEEYIFKQPTGDTVDTVQILALNLRTAGPNAGISSMDFRVSFDEDISTTDLTTLPWGDYMDTYEMWELDVDGQVYGEQTASFQGPSDGYGYYDDTRLIVYEGYHHKNEKNFPLPYKFSLEVKNPYQDSLQVVENYYTDINYATIRGNLVLYQMESGDEQIFINGQQYYYYDDYCNGDRFILPNGDIFTNGFVEVINPELDQDDYGWGEGWNQQNRYTFFDALIRAEAEDEAPAWLMGAIYFINDDGTLISNVDPDYLDADGLDICGIRDLINPDYNVEMVFFSSEFGNTPDNLPDDIASYMGEYSDEADRKRYIEGLYNNPDIRTIDVITIPEITYPYDTEPSPVERTKWP